MEALDISMIFGNALDRVRDMLMSAVENNIPPDMSFPEKTTKKDTLLCGFGLANIKKLWNDMGPV